METTKRKISGKKIALIASLLLLLAVVAAMLIYLTTYYHADEEAIEAFTALGISELEDEDGNLVFTPTLPTEVGFIFYPGGKVEHTAYVPLMRALAEDGIFSVLVEMPFNLAIFDTGAAKDVMDAYPQIEKWYIGGHSLGGAMAASFAAGEDGADILGVALLAAYSTEPLECEVLSVYGSEDGVLNMEKYEEYRKNLGEGATEQIIDGGSHSYFGMYGEQSGDGVAKITPEEQIRLTARLIRELIYK